jgi:hypothetical protein
MACEIWLTPAPRAALPIHLHPVFNLVKFDCQVHKLRDVGSNLTPETNLNTAFPMGLVVFLCLEYGSLRVPTSYLAHAAAYSIH